MNNYRGRRAFSDDAFLKEERFLVTIEDPPSPHMEGPNGDYRKRMGFVTRCYPN